MNKQLPNDLLAVLALSLMARAIFLFTAPAELGSTDIYSWMRVIELLNIGKNPYNETTVLNWPPFWLQVLFLIQKASLYLPVSKFLLTKLVLIAIECMLLIVLYYIMNHSLQIKHTSWWLVIGVSLNPVCIIQVCQHCNFDVLVGFWILAWLYVFLRFHDTGREQFWLLAALFIGIGIWTKTIPIVLVPFLFYGIARVSTPGRIVGFYLTIAPAVIAMSIVFVLGPKEVTAHVLKYRSASGWFGITGIFNLLHLDWLSSIYGTAFALVFPAILIYTAYLLFNVRKQAAPLCMRLALLLIMSIPVLGPGYAPQYLYWFLPLLLIHGALGDNTTRERLALWYVVINVTYLIEYAYFPTHGAFLQHITNELSTEFYNSIASQASQTTIRLPLFMSYLLVFSDLVRTLQRPHEDSLVNEG